MDKKKTKGGRKRKRQSKKRQLEREKRDKEKRERLKQRIKSFKGEKDNPFEKRIERER